MPDSTPGSAVVFGGAGFIGVHLTRKLVELGYDVLIADLDRPAMPVGPSVRFASLDVRRPIELDESPTVAFNLAAVHRTPGHPDHEYYDTNVGGAINITEWCARTTTNRLVFTSSISVYGPTEVPKDESSEAAPTTAYGRSKLLAEQIHQGWASSHDRSLIVARPAVVFGPGERGNFTRLAQALSRGRFVYPGRDDTVKACGYVGDLVRALLFALDGAQAPFTFNYCYPNAYTIREICEAFERVAGYPAPRRIPAPVIDAAVRALRRVPASSKSSTFHPDRVLKVAASTNIVPRALVSSGFEWSTTLESALCDWMNADPAGAFE